MPSSAAIFAKAASVRKISDLSFPGFALSVATHAVVMRTDKINDRIIFQSLRSKDIKNPGCNSVLCRECQSRSSLSGVLWFTLIIIELCINVNQCYKGFNS